MPVINRRRLLQGASSLLLPSVAWARSGPAPTADRVGQAVTDAHKAYIDLINPVTKERMLDEKLVPNVLAEMAMEGCTTPPAIGCTRWGCQPRAA
jgi:hypothetical protein